MPEILLNQSGTMYAILNGFTNDISGSWFLTFLMVILVLMLIALALRIPLEFTAVIVMPLLLAMLSFSSDFTGVAGVFVIYLGILLAKNFFFGR